MSALYAVTLAVYIILLQPILYCLWRHGKRGFLGWFALQGFCIIRIVGSALQLHAEAIGRTDFATVLMSSIGLSPLLIGTLGILHEARSARNPNLRPLIEWSFVINYHFLVAGAMSLIIIGVMKTQNVPTDASGTIFTKVGVILTFVCWILLSIWTLISWTQRSKDIEDSAHADGTMLLYAVLRILPLLAFREAYSIGSAFSGNSDFTSSLAIKVCLSVVPEILVVAYFAVVGVWTRNIPKKPRKVHASDYRGDWQGV